MSEELRMFSFNSMYMNGIHNGIQAGHSWVDMSVKYHPQQDRMNVGTCKMYWEWAREHKTVVVYNGGDERGLLDIIRICGAIDKSRAPLPWVEFREPALCYAHPVLTSVSIVVPARMFKWEPKFGELDPHVMAVDPDRGLDESITNRLTDSEQMLYHVISNKRFAQ